MVRFPAAGDAAGVEGPHGRPRAPGLQRACHPPYQRLLASGQLSTLTKEALQASYEGLNPIALRRQIEERQRQLLKLVLGRDKTRPSRPRKLQPRSVTSFMTQRAAVRLPD